MEEFKPKTSEQLLIMERAERAIDAAHFDEVDRYEAGEFPEILRRIEKGQITKEQMTAVMSTRYQVAHFFEDMLCRIIKNVEASDLEPEAKEALLQSVQVNLNEELGIESNYGGPHKEGREALLSALGINYEEWKRDLGEYDNLGKLDPVARQLVESLKKIADRDPITAVAMLNLYEDRISLGTIGDYYKLLSGLEKLYPKLAKEEYVEGDAFWHVYSHADHDEHHADMAKHGILLAVRNQEDVAKISAGLSETKAALDKFWYDLGKEIKLQ